MNKSVYKLTALTNIHVGSEGANFGIVDNLVQRDIVTNFPVIRSTSLKGALKKFSDDFIKNKRNENIMLKVFGDDKNPGMDKFLSAHLLTYPVRSNFQPFFNATCPAIMNDFVEILDTFNINNSLCNSISEFNNFVTTEFNNNKEIIFLKFIEKPFCIEEWEKSQMIEYKANDDLLSCFGLQANLVIMRDEVFIDLCDNLPVIARNRIEIEKNLWYEEIVPRQTHFWFAHFCESDYEIVDKIIDKKEPVQIGADASVGYGYCNIVKL